MEGRRHAHSAEEARSEEARSPVLVFPRVSEESPSKSASRSETQDSRTREAGAAAKTYAVQQIERARSK